MWNGYIYHVERDQNVHTYTHHIAAIFGQLIIITEFSTTVKSFLFCRKIAEAFREFFAHDHTGIV